MHQAKSHIKCLEAVEAGVDRLSQEHQLYPVSVALGVLSADRLLLSDRAEVLAKRLQAQPEWEDHYAVLKFFRAAGTNVLGREAALQVLLDDFRRLKGPKAVALQLFYVLDASDAKQAADCIEVAECIRKFQQLGLDGEFQLAQAYVTLQDWSALLSVADRAISKYDHVGRFYAIRALALDKLGLAPEALTELRRLVNTSVADRLATDTYVHIVMRSGFVDEALELAERLVAAESDRNRRLESLQLLFNLLQAKEPGTKRAMDVAWAMGQLVDRTDESAEGQFLATFLTATAGPESASDAARIGEFQQRLSDFFEKWPDSRILRRGFLPENASGEELLKALKSILGEPSVLKDDYAKWMLEDPRMNFAISARGGETGVNHLGFQVDSDEELAVMHEPVEDRGAHRVVAQVCAPILHNAVGRDDNASMQFVALMDQRLQQCASGVGDRTRQEQVVQHKQIALEDSPQPGFALGSRAQRVTVEEVVGLKILHLVWLFALSQDYSRRQEWDPFSSRSELLNGATVPAVGVDEYIENAGGLVMVSRYESFQPPYVAAVSMIDGLRLLGSFSGGWKFRRISPRTAV